MAASETKTARVSSWLAAARPLAQANIAPPILLGQALAWSAGVAFEPSLAAVALAFGALDHLAIVFTNDYHDREGDAFHEAPTIFSGGSRVIQEERLRPSQLARAAWVSSLALLAFATLAGFLVDRPWLIGFAVLALALSWAYSVEPLRLSHRGFGELTQGLGVGAVLPLLGYYTQAGELGLPTDNAGPWRALAPLVLLGFVSNIVTALPDLDADAQAGKSTWPVRRGSLRARRDALGLLGVALLLVTQLADPLEPIWIAAAVGPSAAMCAVALFFAVGRDANDARATIRFVTAAAAAITLVPVGWALALWLSAAA